ncbi:alpha-2-macroglobulin-like isoform X2 [Acanthaster planci]|uniref:Alpha-2-macroglobulin-like isoform X2 n=1 Tax=Acanthaster planci TaxID=133434 RepID=A0A8B7YRU1_ACAPL|nr:alpha-2-macroglobulin-like isoform X2 [Acanthaster planci]
MKLIIFVAASLALHGLVQCLPQFNAEDSEDELTPYPFGYLVISPKVLFAGQEESICITIQDAEEPVEVMLSFMENNVTEISRAPPFNVEFETTCSRVEVPTLDESPKRVTLKVQMKRLSASEAELAAEKKVAIVKKESETYVQTDKPIYKPGQPVMFRVLTLDSDLKPDKTATSDIWVETPSGIRVVQWLNQSSPDGLIDLEIPMSSDPPLGEWKIVNIRGGERIERMFKVDEYVLPKFEITADLPPYILTDAEEFEVRICARYTYGQPVRGSYSADITTEEEYSWWYSSSERRPVLRFESADTGSSGCGTIIVPGELLYLNSSEYNIWNSRLQVDVNFTEDATGVTLSETVLSKPGIVTTEPLALSFKAPSTFKPGMPFDVWISVEYPDGSPAPGIQVKVTAKADYRVEIYNQTLTSSDEGMVHFVLEDVNIETAEISLFAVAEGYRNWDPSGSSDDYRYGYYYIYDPTAYLYAEASYSPSGSFVQVAPLDEQLIPGNEVQITTHFTADPETVEDLKWFFVFMSRNEILTVPVAAVEETGSRRRRFSEPVPDILPFEPEKVNITQPGSLYSRQDRFTVTSKMSPAAKLLVYYIRPDKEVVADSISLDVQPEFGNKVYMAFTNAEETPGGKAQLKLSASEGSLCAIGIVDKSVYVLEDDEDRITKEKVFEKLRSDQDHYTNYWVPNRSDHCPDEYPWWWYPDLDRKRRRRTSVPYYGGTSVYEDSSKAFEDMGFIFMSNLMVETRPCNADRYPVIAYNREVAGQEGPVGGAPLTAAAPAVRSFFPETWLWKLERIGDLGEAELDLDVPHTITEWVGNGFCTSAETGLGVADTTTLRAFQPFFVSLTLPYSIIRGEEVTIKATVFNYLSDQCMVIRVSLIASDEFEVVDGTVDQKECVCAQTSKRVEFQVRGLALGEIDVEVHAVSVADDELLCGNEASLSEETGVSDGVRRKLLVEPEGIEHQYSINKYFCPSEFPFYSYIKRFPLPTPPNTVPGSMRGRMSLTGDLMGQTVSNLDNLLQIPTGCGEQNMLGFVPNIVAMQYFTQSGTLTDDLRTRAQTNMKKGYMRELNYRLKDGSYSAFGESDEEGSTWLTAYVVRSFAQAAEFISIDQRDLDVTIDWLKQQQNKQGCFNARGKLCHKAMAGGVNNEITLTSYVVTSLLEAGVAPEDPVILNALSCLESEANTLSDTYAAAQLAYAMVLAGHPAASDVMDYLESVAVTEGEHKRWVSNRDDVAEYDTYYRASRQAQEIEMTAYVLLAYTEYLSPEEARVEGSPVSRWLVSQQSSSGGFSSTQDTVIGLQALAAYAGILSKEPLKLRVEVMERGRKVRQLELLERNKLVVQEMDLNVPNTYTVRARGKGCGLLQFTVYYNMLPRTPPVAPFALTKRSRNLDNLCKKFVTNVCASYTGTGGANMVLAQVKLVTGFVPDTASIADLNAQAMMSKLKRVETEGKTINFYIDQGLDATPVCWDFVANKEFDVNNAKPGTLNMYDYYEKDLAISESLEFLCEPTEEEMPEPDKPVPEVEPTAKPDKPIVPEVEPTAKPDKAVPEVEPTAKPDKPVVPEVEPTAKPDKPVVPEVEPTAKPDKPVVPEVEPTAKPDKPVVPEVEPTAKPDKPVVPEVEPTAKPDKPVVPEVEPTAKPDKPVVPEVKPTDKPVVPEVETTAKPVVPEAEPTAKPEKPVVPEIEPTAKPDKPVVPDIEPTAKPDKPVVPEVESTAKPDKPIVPEVQPTAIPDIPIAPEEIAKSDEPVVTEIEPTATPERTVVPEVEPTDKPVVPEVEPTDKPVVPEVEPTDKPVSPEVEPTDKPVVPEVEPTAKPDKPVVPEVEPTDKPVVPEDEPTAKPDKPVVPESEPTSIPVAPSVTTVAIPAALTSKPMALSTVPTTVSTTVQTTVPTTMPTPLITADTFCFLYPDICGNGVCVDDETQPSFHRCDCDPGYTDERGMCVAITTTPMPTTPTPPPATTEAADSFCFLYPDICGNGVCVDDETQPSFHRCDCDPGYTDERGMCVALTTTPMPTTPTTTPTTTEAAVQYCTLNPGVCGSGVCVDDRSRPSSYRCDCDLGYEEQNGTCVDVDECTYAESCPGPGEVCVNFPSTYECNCRDGYQYDSEGNCISCPVCSDSLPSGFEQKFCAANYVYGAKKRGDGMLRILIELRQRENRVTETRYISPIINPQCVCDEFTYGDRILIVTTMEKVEIERLRRRTIETVDLGGAYIVPLKGSTKDQLNDARSAGCP